MDIEYYLINESKDGLLKCVSWVLIIARGMPYLEKMFSLINFTTTLALLALVGIALTSIDT